LSDLLSLETVAEMQRRVPAMKCASVARVGHAPMLDEADALAAIDALLAEIG
jgi:hypothetical protein